MPIATRSIVTLSPPISVTNLHTALKSALAAAGFSTLISDYAVGGDRVLVYQVTQDAAKAMGTSFLRVRIISSLAIGTQLLTAWSVANNTGSNGSSEISTVALSASTAISLYSLNASPELNLVMLAQGNTHLPIGLLSPYNRPTWWDLNSYSYAFLPLSSTFSQWRASTATPYTTQDFNCSLNSGFLSTPSRITNRRSVGLGVILYAPSNEGDAGRTSDDIVTCSAIGLSRYDSLQVPVVPPRDYFILSNSAGGMGVRTA